MGAWLDAQAPADQSGMQVNKRQQGRVFATFNAFSFMITQILKSINRKKIQLQQPWQLFKNK